jgi:hypothetical protein
MKKKILTLGVLFAIQSVCCQAQNLGDWIVSVNVGIEAHDKRLFNYARPEREALLRMQPEFWGTYHVGLNARRKVWHSRKLSSFLGLGVNYENATFRRPFDHFYFQNPSDDILLALNRYKKVFTPMSLLAFYELGNHWLISGELASSFLVFRSIDHTEWSRTVFPFSEGTFELDDIQLRLGVNNRLGKFIIGLHSRVANFQKIDRVIFNRIVKDPRTDQTWEWDNPLRFDLTVGYTW